MFSKTEALLSEKSGAAPTLPSTAPSSSGVTNSIAPYAAYSRARRLCSPWSFARERSLGPHSSAAT